jgi:phosphopantothenoylcysteine decarboxylase/phosphopantothenate--cysteine ligase
VRRSTFENLRDEKVLITAGPTREYWDPVRFLSNGSSGRMGIALAQEATRRGARVTLVLGPVNGRLPRRRKNLRVVRAVSALEMDKKVRSALPGTQVFVGAAAVADYRPAVMRRQKIKGKPVFLRLRLVRNPDIIAKVARRGRRRPPLVIGFALETQGLIKNATAKRRRKGLDWIIANRDSNVGSREGSATLLSRWGERIRLVGMPKERLAKRMWQAFLSRSALQRKRRA